MSQVDADGETISVTVSLGPRTEKFTFPAEGSTLDDLTLACEDAFGADVYNWSTHKFIAPPPIGLLKGGEHGTTPLDPRLDGKKLRLLAARLADVDSLRAAEASARRRDARRAAASAKARRAAQHHHHHSRRSPEDSTYTFLSLRPLPYLPHPERSLTYLERLRDDPGIRAVMRARRFAVGLLTEMDPAAHTDVSHEGVGRTLGLNRNQGEVIELRLRTDAGDGYRDYATVRKTLCHELAHNVHGPHDRNFWDLCHAIEREVAAADWRFGGRTVGDAGPGFARGPAGDQEEEDVYDHGGWTGGEFVLGGRAGSSGGDATPSTPALSRREILAKAAEERLKRINQERRDGDAGDGQR